jgi:hypothetical protein
LGRRQVRSSCWLAAAGCPGAVTSQCCCRVDAKSTRRAVAPYTGTRVVLE